MAEEKLYVWVLLPVAVEKGHELDVKSYEFENDRAYFDGDGATAWGLSMATNYDDALKTMEAL